MAEIMATQLTPLPEVERISKTCIRILGGNPGKFTLQGTNTYLIGTGPKRILIDAAQGLPSWTTAVKRVLNEENATIETCLITHWHGDHTAGIPELLSFSPETGIYKHEPGDEQQDILDGQVFSVEGATLTALHSPGHTTDHVTFVLKEEDAMFTGDCVLGHGTAVFEDLATYLDSLARMRDSFSGRGYPGHGAVIADGPAKIGEYQSHRQLREDQVLKTLQGGREGRTDGGNGWSSMDLVRVIYVDIRKDLYEAAERGVVQILVKLEKEGRVVKLEDGTWLPSERSAL